MLLDLLSLLVKWFLPLTDLTCNHLNWIIICTFILIYLDGLYDNNDVRGFSNFTLWFFSMIGASVIKYPRLSDKLDNIVCLQCINMFIVEANSVGS